MEIKFIKLQHIPAMSQETQCFTGIVAVDGIPCFEAANRGYGGADDYRPLKGMETLFAQAEAYAKTLPAQQFGDGPPLAYDLELWVGAAFTRFLNARRLRRLMSGNILYVYPSATTIWQAKKGPVPQITVAKILNIPAARVLNTMPFDEALTIYLSTPPANA